MLFWGLTHVDQGTTWVNIGRIHLQVSDVAFVKILYKVRFISHGNETTIITNHHSLLSTLGSYAARGTMSR